jgi:hypothetical protein
MKQCAKCNDEADGSMETEGGEVYLFCKACSDLLEKVAPGNTISNFLGREKKEKWVEKNMREARERRKNGIKLWS